MNEAACKSVERKLQYLELKITSKFLFGGFFYFKLCVLNQLLESCRKGCSAKEYVMRGLLHPKVKASQFSAGLLQHAGTSRVPLR